MQDYGKILTASIIKAIFARWTAVSFIFHFFFFCCKTFTEQCNLFNSEKLTSPTLQTSTLKSGAWHADTLKTGFNFLIIRKYPNQAPRRSLPSKCLFSLLTEMCSYLCSTQLSQIQVAECNYFANTIQKDKSLSDLQLGVSQGQLN